jgi:hypothetical protein
LLFGLGSLVLAGWFWPAVVLIYGSLGLGAADLWLEPDLQTKVIWKLGMSAVILGFASLFTFGFVLVAAPLPISDIATNGEYPADHKIGDIAWRKEFTELDIGIENPTSRAYEDVNLVIRPDNPVAAVTQIGKTCDASIEDADGVMVREGLKPAVGDSRMNPLVLVATDAGYRIRCAHLPANSILKIVMAISDI